MSTFHPTSNIRLRKASCGLWFIGLVLLFCSCSSKRFLQENEHLITKNNINIIDEDISSGEERRIKELLEPRLLPEPNSNYFFFFPKERAALKYRHEVDTPRFTLWLMRLDGEEPALTDTVRIRRTADQIAKTMAKEGYFNASADFYIQYRKKKSRITYNLMLGPRFVIDSHDIVVADTSIARLIRSDSAQQRMSTGVPLTEDLHNAERKRIASLLRNNGYYDFSPSNIPKFDADTSEGRADVNLFVLAPEDDSLFTSYTIGSITIFPGYRPDVRMAEYSDTLISGIHFRYLDDLIVKPRLMIQKLEFAEGDLYSYEDYRQTILQLNTLDIFKTPRIAVKKRIMSPGILDYEIYLAQEKKFDDASRQEIYASSFGPQELFLGLNLNGGRTIRNLLGGAETFSINLDGSFESTFREGDNGSITNIGINMSLKSPKYNDLLTLGGLRLVPGMKKMLNDDYMHDLKRLGEEFIHVNLSFEDVQEFYQSTAFNVSRGVQLNRGRSQTSWVFQSFDLLSPSEKSQFDSIVGDNRPFREAFEQQLTTGILFRSFKYRYQSPLKRNKVFTISGGFSASGHEVALINLITDDALSSINFLGDSFTFNQFVKLEVEPKLTLFLNPKSSFAFRLGTGVILPFNNSSLPYNELFSLGGAYSMRGWLPRQVGPGSVDQTDESTIPIPFSADQFKIELSAEFRQDLGWIVEGALFADAGNVWALASDAPEDNRFSLDNYGLSAGFGLRFDLTFFLFRTDLAFPVRNWFPDESGSYWRTSSLSRLLSDPQVNIGINYPF